MGRKITKLEVLSKKKLIKKTSNKKPHSLMSKKGRKKNNKENNIKNKLKSYKKISKGILKKDFSFKELPKKIKSKSKKKHSLILKKRQKTRKNILLPQSLESSQPHQLIIKHLEGPIISPKTENNWEWNTFNPGVILLENKVHFLYRAQGKDWISRLGYAVSNNGFEIDERFSEIVYEHSSITGDFSFSSLSLASGGGLGGCEDPRLVRVGKEDTIYMTYTANDQGLRMCLTSIKIQDFLNRKWRWKLPVFFSPPNLVGKNWILFPEKIKGRYAILHSTSPQILISYFDNLDFNDNNYIVNHYYNPIPRGDYWRWETWIRGVGPPPIKTKDGWLVFYHAHDKDLSKYKVGAMLLDLEDPTKILALSPKPILQTTEIYENIGFKPGIIYATGAIVKDNDLLIYYGSADSYICVAYVNFEEFITSLKKEVKLPELKRKTLKTKGVLKKIEW